MAVSAYYAWANAGRPFILATPIRELEAYARSHAIPVLGTLGNEAHLTASFPEDHTPFSFTALPIPLPGWYVCAIDLANVRGLGDAILRDARAGRCPWLKYMNFAGRSYAYADGFRTPAANDDQHIHLSVFSDWCTRSIGPYDPLEDDVSSADVDYTLKHIKMPNGDEVAHHAAMTVAMAQLANLTAAAAADEVRDKATLTALTALKTSGGSLDTAAVITAVRDVRAEAQQQYQQLLARLAELEADNAQLRADLAAAARAEADALAAPDPAS